MVETLARVTPTTDYAALAGADFVIEAVFEDVAIKAEVTKKVEEVLGADVIFGRSEEHTSELQSLMRISYAVFCLKKKNKDTKHQKENSMEQILKKTDKESA